ncbi:dephospho-CoA kinase-domain-containing protein [Mycena sp. CBHHK59/15]|nr:dephospho-CoA kinase-domain-containing protein [Mycena sp. CBHHK59/15]
MLVVGLTGGIATGKSSVSNLLKAKHIPIVDADVLARQVVEPGTPALKKIVASFGSDVLQDDGSLDRKKLGSIIFNDESKRRKLNSIVHPAVRRAMLWNVIKHWLSGRKYCIVDVPLLIEGGLWKWVGKVVVVYWLVAFTLVLPLVAFDDIFSNAEVQLERLMQRDNSSREDASSRLNSQLAIADKLQYADVVIDNSGSPEDLGKHISAFVRDLDLESGWTWRFSWIIPPFGILSAIWALSRRAIARSKRYRMHNRSHRICIMRCAGTNTGSVIFFSKLTSVSLQPS